MRLAAVLLALVAAPAFAQGDATARVRREAENHLRPCVATETEARRRCELNRQEFVRDYLRARAGELQGQRNVAYQLAGPAGEAAIRGHQEGIVADPMQACAWRIVVMSTGHAEANQNDEAKERLDCGRLSEAQRAAARIRASELHVQIATDPVRKPPGRGRSNGLGGPESEVGVPQAEAPGTRHAFGIPARGRWRPAATASTQAG